MELLALALAAAALGAALGVLWQRRRAPRDDAALLIEALQCAPISVNVADGEGRLCAAEGGAIRLAGYRPGDLLGADLEDLLTEGDEVIPRWRAALAGGAPTLTIHRGEARGRARAATYATWIGPVGVGAALITLEISAAHDATVQARIVAALEAAEGGEDGRQ